MLLDYETFQNVQNNNNHMLEKSKSFDFAAFSLFPRYSFRHHASLLLFDGVYATERLRDETNCCAEEQNSA